MLSAYRPVAALLVATFFAVAGNGMVGTLLPLTADLAGWTKHEIGLLGSAYFTGMLLGALLAPAVIRRVGHDRAFMTVIATATISILVFSVLRHPIAWALARATIGFSFAIIYSTVESWLQATSANAVRGRVLAVYSIVQYLGWASGNELINLDKPGSALLFEVAAIILAAATIPIAMSVASTPPRPSNLKMPIALLWRTAPVGVVGTFLIGLTSGPFWSLSPLFGTGIGMTSGEVSTFVTMLTVGAGLLQWPVGRLSDRFDRRQLLVVIILACVFVELLLGTFGQRLPFFAVNALGLILGGVVTTQYYVLIAHVNDRIDRGDIVGVSALMLFVYCVGAIVGPITAADAMARFGPGALLLHNVVIHAGFAAYVVWRIIRAGPPVRLDTPVVMRSASS